MESKNWYIIILVLSLIVTIFSLINFIQFLNIRNDDDPTVSENSSLALIILNAIVAFGGFIIALYCIWKLIKKDNYEPKTFQAYRNQYKKTNADVPENPLEACDEIAKLKTEDDLKNFNKSSRYPKLNIDIERFTAECKEYGITPEDYDKQFPAGSTDAEGNYRIIDGKLVSGESAEIGAGLGYSLGTNMNRGPGGGGRGGPGGGMGGPGGGMGGPGGGMGGVTGGGGMGAGSGGMGAGSGGMGAVPAKLPVLPVGKPAIPTPPITGVTRATAEIKALGLNKAAQCRSHKNDQTACEADTANNCYYDDPDCYTKG